MAKIFDVDFRTGSLIDRVSGNIGTNSYGIVSNSDKGLCWNGNGVSTKITYPISSLSARSVEFWFNTKSFARQAIAGGILGGYMIYMSSGRIGTFNVANGNATSNRFSDGKWHICIINRSNSNVFTFYVDGVLQSGISDGDWRISTAVTIGVSGGNGDLPFNGYITKIIGRDSEMSEAERAKAYSDFLNSHPLEIEQYPKHLDTKPNDLSYLKEGKLTDELLVTDPTYGFVANRADKWTPQGSNTVEQEGNAVKITYVSNIYGAVQKISAAVGNVASNPIIGNYQLVIRAKAIGSVSLIWFDGVGAYPGVLLSSEYVTYVVNFPINHATNAGFQFGNMGAGEVAWVEIISLKQKVGLVAAYNMRPVGNTLVDISGNGYGISNIKDVSTTSKGLLFNNKLILKLNAGTSLTNIVKVSNTWTISCKIKVNSINGIQTILGSAASANDRIALNIRDYKLVFQLYNGTSIPKSTSYNLVLGQEYTLVAINTNTVTAFYVNGIAETGTAIGSTDGTNLLSIGTQQDGIEPFIGEIHDLRIYNYALSESEVKAYHNSFAKRTYLQENFALEGADGVAKVPSGWSKVSGSFKVWEINIAPAWVDDCSIDKSAYYSVQDGTRAYNGEEFIRITGTSSTVHLFKSFSFKFGGRYKVSYEARTPIGHGSSLYVSIRPSAGGTVGQVLSTNLTLHESWTKYIHNFILNEGAQTGGINWYDNGALAVGEYFDIRNIVIEELPPLPTFKPGTKYLEGSGTIAIPSTQSSGTFEFDFYVANNQALRINAWSKIKDVYSDSGNGYMIYIVAGIIYFYKVTGSVLFNTASNYISYTTWYRLKVTRSTLGVFTFYIKGGAFGTANWTLVSTAGGLGTNPVTDNTYNNSRYFVIKSEHSLHRIANIKLTEGIEA